MAEILDTSVAPKPEALSVQELRSLIQYDPETGTLTWLKKRGKKLPGDVAGSVNNLGYVQVTVNYQPHLAHRVAYALMIGQWPPQQIDHINGNPTDNRWENLRPSNQNENAWNQGPQKNNTSGHKGVHWVSANRNWRAMIGYRGQKISLGNFSTKEEAADAYARAAKKLHGEFARV